MSGPLTGSAPAGGDPATNFGGSMMNRAVRAERELRAENERLRARLAEVEALCDDELGWLSSARHMRGRVRAIARGEGDRPAMKIGDGRRTWADLPPAEPWPDEDAARFLAHERAQRSD